MQQSSVQVTSKTNQSESMRLSRIAIFLCVLAALVGISALGTKASRVATNVTAGPLPSVGAAFATSQSSGFSNAMPLP